MKALVVTADDFGRSPGVNRGIARAHEEGIVTSASLMVDRPAAAEAAAYAATHPRLAVGLHVDLGEWVYGSNGWRARYERPRQHWTRSVARQLERFRELVGRDPTHLDSHQHVHRREPARTALLGLAGELGVPLRHFSETVRYCGDFYGQTAEGDPLPGAITVEALIRLLTALPEGTTELGCHPGETEGLDSTYADERPREVEALCDPHVRSVLDAEGIELRSFAEVRP